MSFEPKCEEIVIKSLKQISSDENANVIITLGEDSKVKLVSTSVFSTVEKVVPSTKSAQIELRIKAEAIVKNQNGEYECLKNENVMSVLVVNNYLDINSPVFAVSKVKRINSQTSGNNINVETVIGLSIYSVFEEKQACVVDVGVENQKIITATLSDIVANSTQEFNLESELEQPQGVKKILTYESDVILQNVEAGNDLITLVGSLNTNLVYLTDDEVPKLKNQFFSQSFSHELLYSNLTVNDKVWTILELNQTKLELEGELNSAKGTILLSANLMANVLVQKDELKPIVIDAFCPDYYLNMTSCAIENPQLPSILILSDRIDGSVSLSDDSPRIDRILCVTESNVDVESTEAIEQGVIVKGKLSCNIVFTLDDEECSVNSCFAVIPFENRIKCDIEHNVTVVGKVKGVDARNKRAKEIDIIADVEFCISSSSSSTVNMISNISLGEKRKNTDCAFKIYFVDSAEDLWALSKKLGVSSQVLSEQNPELEFPIIEPKQIVVYQERVIS